MPARGWFFGIGLLVGFCPLSVCGYGFAGWGRVHFSVRGLLCWAHFSAGREGPRGAGSTFCSANVPTGSTKGRFVYPAGRVTDQKVTPAKGAAPRSAHGREARRSLCRPRDSQLSAPRIGTNRDSQYHTLLSIGRPSTFADKGTLPGSEEA